MDSIDKPQLAQTNIKLRRDVVDSLIKLKKTGDSYSDIIERLLKEAANK